MSSMRPGWRRILRAHGGDFLLWLRDNAALVGALERLASDVEAYTLAALEDEHAARTFREAIPDVLARCDEDIYDRPLRAEAYAFIHLLERYRRMWRVLCELTTTADLPLAVNGVRTLDVGAGPAPVIFAVSDFYGAMTQYAKARGVPQLELPPPEATSVEASPAMERFVHSFCEVSGRMSGPFRAEWRDFSSFDPAGRRERRLQDRVAAIVEEDDTSEQAARRWVHASEGEQQAAHTYRLCVFSNFLTTPESVEAHGQRLARAFEAVTPGGVVLVMGGVRAQYPQIYEQCDSRAADAGLRRLDVQDRFPPPDAPDSAGAIIKRVYRTVWARLDQLGHGEVTGLDKLRDVWDPQTPYTTSAFALRAFRRNGTNG